jgi:hypothetical protein
VEAVLARLLDAAGPALAPESAYDEEETCMTEMLAGALALSILWAPLAWIACALWASMADDSKARSGGGWLLAGMLFGPLALLSDLTVHQIL